MKILTNGKVPGKVEPIQILIEKNKIKNIQPVNENLNTFKIDLNGKYILPGFADSHCHILHTGMQLQKPDLAACQNKQELLEKIFIAHQESPKTEWVIVKNYDPNKLDAKDHLSQDDLDLIDQIRPILVQHSSGHAGVANSGALSKAPTAKHIEGYLVEKEYQKVYSAEPIPSLEKMVESILATATHLSKLGITSATEMMAGYYDLEQELLAYHLASKRGASIRLRLFLEWNKVFGPDAISEKRLKELMDQMDQDICNVIGIKLFADGALGTKTAAVYEEYIGGGYGHLLYEPGVFKEKIKTAHQAGWSIAVHSIGDRATDLVLEAYSELDDAASHRIEHAMVLNDSQIKQMACLGCCCTMQPEFLSHFAYSYQKNIGKARTSTLKPFRSVVEAGIGFGLSSDRPFVHGNPWEAIRIASDRPENFDSSENLSLEQAIAAYTEGSARLNYEGDLIGKLQPGYFADLQIYAEDPLLSTSPTLLTTLFGGEETVK